MSELNLLPECMAPDGADPCDGYKELYTHIQALEKENGELREVLKFYANKDNWLSPSSGFMAQYDPEPSLIQKDRGKKAKEALDN